MELDGIDIFVKVVQAGSFSRAAKQLGMPNSTVSAKVSALEKRLGVSLLQRTTRKLHVTQAGEAYFHRCAQALAELQAAEKELESERDNEKKYEILAKDLDVAKEDIIEMEQRMSARDLSLDDPFDDDHEMTHLNLLQEASPNQEEVLAEEQEKKIRGDVVVDALNRLNDKEKYVIQNRVMADSPLTLQEIGDHLKLSRERVRQIESEALKKLKRESSPRIPLQA